jgi:hypothetical protein
MLVPDAVIVKLSRTMRLNLRFLDDKDVQDSGLLSRLRTQFVDTERLIALPFELGDFGCWKRREWASD